MSDDVKHAPVLITGIVRAKKGGPITDVRIEGLGIREKDWVIRKIEQGYDFNIRRGHAPLAQITVKDTLQDDGTMRKDLVSVGEGELNNLGGLTEVSLNFDKGEE